MQGSAPTPSAVIQASPNAVSVRVASGPNGDVATTAPVTIFDSLNLLTAPIATALPLVPAPGALSQTLIPCGFASVITGGIGSWIYSVGANATGACTVTFTDAAGNAASVLVIGTN
jgi:hypothetical protein